MSMSLLLSVRLEPVKNGDSYVKIKLTFLLATVYFFGGYKLPVLHSVVFGELSGAR